MAQDIEQSTNWDRFRLSLGHFFANKRVELAIGILIVISISFILAELILDEAAPLQLKVINYAFLVLFAVELALRAIAESTEEHWVRNYFKRWWLDLIAVYPPLVLIPLEQQFALPVLRSLRLLRLLRLGRVFSSARYLFPYVVKKGAVHFGLVVGAMLISVIVGTAVMLALERGSNPDLKDPYDAFWFSLYSIFAGEPIPDQPSTTEGRIASVLLLFAGLLVFALFVGTVSALMVERLQKEEEMRGLEHMEDHVIICGLGRTGYRILEVLQRLDQKVVVIERDATSEFYERAEKQDKKKVRLIPADVRDEGVLEKAWIQTARAVIACTDDDMTNLGVALDARHVRPDIRVVLRMFDEKLAEKVGTGFNIQVAFSTSSLAAPAFAAAAVDRSVQGSLDVDGRVYIHSEFEVPEESSLAGMTVAELRENYEVHTLAVQNGNAEREWSPPVDYEIRGGATIAILGPFDEVAKLKEEVGVSQNLVKALGSEETVEAPLV